MNDLYRFAGEHPVLAFFLAWVAAYVVTLPFRLAVRVIRAITVAARGWPPAHLDADGDWKS